MYLGCIDQENCPVLDQWPLMAQSGHPKLNWQPRQGGAVLGI